MGNDITVSMPLHKFEEMMKIINSKTVYVRQDYGLDHYYESVGTHQEYIDSLVYKINLLERDIRRKNTETKKVKEMTIREFKEWVKTTTKQAK